MFVKSSYTVIAGMTVKHTLEISKMPCLKLIYYIPQSVLLFNIYTCIEIIWDWTVFQMILMVFV